MVNYLVTGGLGFLGSALVKKLSKKKNSLVYVLDNSSRRRIYQKLKRRNIKYYSGDIRNYKIRFMSKINIVYHLAYINGTENFYKYPKDVLDVGINGTINLIDQINKNGKNVKKFIYASSSEVYQQSKIIPTPEEMSLIVPNVLNPRFTYGGSKILGEQLTLFYLNNKVKKIIFRPHNFYGPNMGYNHIIPEICGKILKAIKIKNQKEITIDIEGSGNETRSFCYIDDAIRAIIKITNSSKDQIFNIGNEDEIKIIDLIKKMLKILNVKGKINKGPLKLGSVKRRCPDIKKLKKNGYSQLVDIDSGLKKTIDWYKKN